MVLGYFRLVGFSFGVACLSNSVMVGSWMRRSRFDGSEVVRHGLSEVADVELERAAPVREFPSYRGQRHFPGMCYAALERVSVAALIAAGPVREFRWHKGRTLRAQG